jgi:hypothetical protein
MTNPADTGMVPDEVFEGLKRTLADAQEIALRMLTSLSNAPATSAIIHERLQAAHQANQDMMQLAQLVAWQEAKRKELAESRRQDAEGVLQ